MAPRKDTKSQTLPSRGTRSEGAHTSRSTGTRIRSGNEAGLDPYQDLVREYLATESGDATGVDVRGAKRRRVGGREVRKDGDEDEGEGSSAGRVTAGPSMNGKQKQQQQQQVAYEDFHVDDDDDEDDEDDSDVEFEDVFPSTAASVGTRGASLNPSRSMQISEDLDLVLDSGGESSARKKASSTKRKGLTAADRKMRLSVHKIHVLALIAHVRLRSRWCNDDDAQNTLRRLVPSDVKKMFKDDRSQTQWQRSRSLKMGLEKAIESFQGHFEISTRGMARAYWSEVGTDGQIDSTSKDCDLPITKQDFVQLSTTRSASRDVGAQLFCAMLRSLGLDVRLVCSLQLLPLRATPKSVTPSKPVTTFVPHNETRIGMNVTPTKSVLAANGPNVVPQGVRRFGHAPSATSTPARTTVAAAPIPLKKKRIRESQYPVFWVEVFNEADHKWIPVDPLVLKLIDKPSKYEPPANDAENQMSYVIAVDEDGHVKDVTRRYAHAYNAKTRRSRVEATRDGSRWWNSVMQIYLEPLPLDREQIEDSELAGKESREPMPRNIVEFKNHPYYALERHLRLNEMLEPRRQVGTVSVGANKAPEPIYRRADVRLVRSADAWFRQGRQIKMGEMPMKYLEAKKNQGRKQADDMDDDDEQDASDGFAGTPLYATHQTQQYYPPPVLGGIVPKNMYGNIDVYTPSMVPAGGVWINHPFAGGAAKLLMIDWADAVTGFEFRGRTGTAVIKGIVVAVEYCDAVVETVKGLQYAFEQEETTKRTAIVLYTWKRFLTALRIRRRIMDIPVAGEEAELAAAAATDREANDQSGSEYEDDDNDEGGGFLPDRNQEDGHDTDISMPSMPEFEPLEHDGPTNKALLDSKAPILITHGEPLAIEQTLAVPDLFMPEYDAGGFMPETDTDTGMAGGFVAESHTGVDMTGGFIIKNEDPMDEEVSPEVNVLVEEVAVPALTAQQASNAIALNIDPMGEPLQIGHKVLSKQSADLEIQEDPVLEKPELQRQISSISDQSHDTSNSLLSHDPEEDDGEPEWI